MKQKDIERVLKEYPNLCDTGFRYDRKEDFQASRDRLLNSAHACTLCQDYLKSRKSKGRYVSSYELKHRVEKKAGEYISNGALIVAAIHCGLAMNKESDFGPNRRFKI